MKEPSLRFLAQQAGEVLRAVAGRGVYKTRPERIVYGACLNAAAKILGDEKLLTAWLTAQGLLTGRGAEPRWRESARELARKAGHPYAPMEELVQQNTELERLRRRTSSLERKISALQRELERRASPEVQSHDHSIRGLLHPDTLSRIRGASPEELKEVWEPRFTRAFQVFNGTKE